MASKVSSNPGIGADMSVDVGGILAGLEDDKDRKIHERSKTEVDSYAITKSLMAAEIRANTAVM